MRCHIVACRIVMKLSQVLQLCVLQVKLLSLIQMMACRLICTKSSYQPMLSCCCWYRYLWDFLHHIYSAENWYDGWQLTWPFRFVAVPVCGRFGLWPFWFVAVPVCGHFGLWPFRSLAVPVCGRFGLWPFRFVAVSVCGRFGLWPFRLWPFRFVAVMTCYRQGDIAASVGVVRKNLYRIILRQAATASLEPGKLTGAPRKTTAHQQHALLSKVREDCFKSAPAFSERMGNVYGVRVGCKMITNLLLGRGYHARRIPRKPLLTANHRRFRLDWERRCQNLTVAAWSHVIWGDESRFQLYPVDGRIQRLQEERFQ